MRRQGWAATCPETQLRGYVTKRIARVHRRRIARDTHHRTSDLRVQGCEYCLLWHVRWRLGGGRG
ncbi:hypothetical protein AB0B28_08265 [Glycomyces sp. NPDC046736]|uniref:hypothetical protein n=1 Tax=Glycomyces sp. NPDC046736 TaxID=3155615 RepID=UPI0033DEEEA3